MFERIQKELAEYFDIDAATITRETTFADDLKADSLALMELMFSLESETGKTLDDDVIEKVKTVGELCDLLEK
ncbi:MAG: acyl carrier protein [Clostridiales bacterium]|uniref:acyl carrier protein n=1 Tax=Anaerocaecibacter muris TaxID=2941513 RepID=UPI00203D1D3B|nr:acyl carrier protein [Anaerocaecibacter muris]MDE6965806.1 acyl carrier protein [Clostridiales bacterium]